MADAEIVSAVSESIDFLTKKLRRLETRDQLLLPLYLRPAVAANLGAGGIAYLGLNNLLVTESSVQLIVGVSYNFTGLSVIQSAAPGVGQTTQWTLRKNGVSTGLSVIIADTNVSGTAQGFESFSPFDLLDVMVVQSAAAATITFGSNISMAVLN